MPDSSLPTQSRPIVWAPWTSAQCNRIAAHQQRSDLHPLTCEHHSATPLSVSLIALWCSLPGCDYRQAWVPASIAGQR